MPIYKISVFSGGYRQNSFFSTFLTLTYIPESFRIKIRNCLFFQHYFPENSHSEWPKLVLDFDNYPRLMAILHHTSHDGVTKERLQTPGSLQYFDAWDNTKYSPEWGFSGNPRNLRFFGRKIPKNPQTLCQPRPQNFPNSFFGDFRG